MFLAVRQVGAFQILVSNGREKHDAWRALAIVLLPFGLIDPLGKDALVVAGVLVPCLVCPEEGEYDVGLGYGEIVMWVDETPIAWAFVHFVATKSVISKDQCFFGHSQLGVGL